MKIELRDEAATLAFGVEWSQNLKPGHVVALIGELGAGKTTFVRGVLTGLGQAEPVRSPTFNLIQLYETQPPVLHCDLYRLQGERFDELADFLDSHVCLIEWPDRLPDLPYTHTFRFAWWGEGRQVEIDLLEQSPVGL